MEHWANAANQGTAAAAAMLGTATPYTAYVVFWLADGRVTAGMNVNTGDVNEHLQRLARRRARIDPARLADPRVPLDDLAAETADA